MREHSLRSRPRRDRDKLNGLLPGGATERNLLVAAATSCVTDCIDEQPQWLIQNTPPEKGIA